MNNNRRRQIRKEIMTLQTIKQLVDGYNEKYNGKILSEEEVEIIKDALENASSLLTDVSSTIDDLGMEERDCFDNLPEGLQMAEKGEAMELHEIILMMQNPMLMMSFQNSKNMTTSQNLTWIL